MSRSVEGVRVVGRYALHGVLAAGGMATVHLGRLQGAEGFSRTVAIKRMHPQYASDPEFVSMFLDEARLASRVRHPNVVPVIDVVSADGEVLLVMEYVQGETLARLIRRANDRSERIPPPLVASIMCDALDGLHAAHEARDESGAPLHIVHRDVSPQNIIVGVDGAARVLDFGIAKASGRSQVTREGQLKGKLAYMAPEQLHNEVSRLTDVYAAGVVLWEALTGKRLFLADSEAATVMRILSSEIELPSKVSGVPEAYDAVVLKALAAEPEHRFQSTREMSVALARAGKADPHEVADWVATVAKDVLETRASLVSGVESAPAVGAMDAVDSVATRADLSTDTLGAPKRRAPWLLAAAGIAVALSAVGGTLVVTRFLGGAASTAETPQPPPPAADGPTAELPTAAASVPAVSASPQSADAGASTARPPSHRPPGGAHPQPSPPTTKTTKLPDFL